MQDLEQTGAFFLLLHFLLCSTIAAHDHQHIAHGVEHDEHHGDQPADMEEGRRNQGHKRQRAVLPHPTEGVLLASGMHEQKHGGDPTHQEHGNAPYLAEKGIPHSVEPVITGEQKQHQSRGNEVLHDGMSYTGVLLVAALDRLQEDPLEKSNGDRSGEESHTVYRM